MTSCWTYVYVISPPGEREFAKVGIANKPEKRLASIQTACPFEIEIFIALGIPSRPLALAIEGQIHDFFRKKKIRGEWFNVDPVLCGIAVCECIYDVFHAAVSAEKAGILLDQIGVTSTLKRLLEVA